MKAIETVVRAKLDAQVGQEAAAALWERLWSAYEAGGVEGAQSFIEGLLELSATDGGSSSDKGDEE
jgi:hypothetical protein